MKRLLFLLALAACGAPAHPEPRPEAVDAGPKVVLDEAGAKETAASLIDFLAAMAAIVEQPECIAMAQDLDVLFTQSAPLFEIVKEAQADPGSKERLLAAFDAREADVAPLVERIGPALDKCHDEPAMQTVMQRMPVL